LRISINVPSWLFFAERRSRLEGLARARRRLGQQLSKRGIVFDQIINQVILIEGLNGDLPLVRHLDHNGFA
jgi:hypothetical protein